MTQPYLAASFNSRQPLAQPISSTMRGFILFNQIGDGIALPKLGMVSIEPGVTETVKKASFLHHVGARSRQQVVWLPPTCFCEKTVMFQNQ